MQYGIGTIDEWARADGSKRYRARIPDGRGGYKTLRSFDSTEEAERALTALAAERAAGTLALDGETLRSWGQTFLARREANGGRNSKTDRSRWERHVMAAPFADWPLESIAPKHVAVWIDRLTARRAGDKRERRTLSAQTVRHAVALLRRALQVALTRGLVKTNAAAGHDLPKVRSDGWTYLTPEEIARITTAPEIPQHDRLAIAFAIGTGLRQGEQWTLELRDVHVDDPKPHIIVRWGGIDEKTGRPTPPKDEDVRRVPLFGLALEAARTWLALLPMWCERNPAGLMWPTQRGYRRRDGKPPRGWAREKWMAADRPSYLEAAGLADPKQRHDGRGVHWHVLRHTAATALLCGWWGRRWRLEEVQHFLGHSDRSVTERYAHLAAGVLDDAACATPGVDAPEATPSLAPAAACSSNLPGTCQGPEPTDTNWPCFLGRATEDSNLWPSAPEARETSRKTPRFKLISCPSGGLPGRFKAPDLRQLAEVAVKAAAEGSPFTVRRLLDLAGAVLEATDEEPAATKKTAG